MTHRFQLAAFSVGILAVAAAGFALAWTSAPSSLMDLVESVDSVQSVQLGALVLPDVVSGETRTQPLHLGLRSDPLPPSGDFRLSDDGRRLGVVANGASRKAIVRALGEARDFDVSDHSVGDHAVNFSIDDSSLEQVLAVLMAETPYQLDYTLDIDRGVARPAKLSIGATEAAQSDEPLLAVRTNPAGRPKPLRSPEKEQRREQRDAEREALVAMVTNPSPRYRRAVLEARAKREDGRRDALLERLEEAEPQDVVNELWKLDPEDPTAVAFLVTRLQSPNTGVRVAAARQLEFARDSQAGAALRAALADPHPHVVKTAIDSLRVQGSQVALGELDALRAHSDPEVRLSAELALAKLR